MSSCQFLTLFVNSDWLKKKKQHIFITQTYFVKCSERCAEDVLLLMMILRGVKGVIMSSVETLFVSSDWLRRNIACLILFYVRIFDIKELIDIVNK